jgi:D-alanyl-lipoteichoic acid acyltransferase DltB (MBOAT superfamily)
MSVCSIEFILALSVASAVFYWLPTLDQRRMFLALCNVAFLGSHIHEPLGWLALGLFTLSGYAVARVLQTHPGSWIVPVYVTLIVAVFLVLKRYEFLKAILPAPVFANHVTIVGLSYMLFRQIHVAIDASQGQIERLTIGTYVNYQINLFGLLAGPIQRYQEFQESWDKLETNLPDLYAVLRAYRRIFLGIIKIVLLAAPCLAYYESISEGFLKETPYSRVTAAVKILIWLYLYPLYIYFNFSGYCDIVIAGASLFGIGMPENFDSPFLARNLIDYWTRFHKTLGFWIRDYVFTPLYRMIATHWPAQAASLAFACYFVAFFLAGVWHGSTWNFVIYGILNAIGVSAAKLWETYLVKRRGRPGLRAYMQSQRIRAVAIFANFHFVCLTVVFFPANMERTLAIIRSCYLRLSGTS